MAERGKPSAGPRPNAAADAARELSELVPRLYRLLRTALDADAGSPSLEQLRVLHRVDEGRDTVSALAATRQMRMSAITAVVDTLEARGWVTRRADLDDRRVTRLTLTASGRAALRRGRQQATRRMTDVLGHLDGDAAALATAIATLSEAVGAYEAGRAT